MEFLLGQSPQNNGQDQNQKFIIYWEVIMRSIPIKNQPIISSLKVRNFLSVSLSNAFQISAIISMHSSTESHFELEKLASTLASDNTKHICRSVMLRTTEYNSTSYILWVCKKTHKLLLLKECRSKEVTNFLIAWRGRGSDRISTDKLCIISSISTSKHIKQRLRRNK